MNLGGDMEITTQKLSEEEWTNATRSAMSRLGEYFEICRILGLDRKVSDIHYAMQLMYELHDRIVAHEPMATEMKYQKGHHQTGWRRLFEAWYD